MNTSDNKITKITGKRLKITQYKLVTQNELEVYLQQPRKKSFVDLDLSGLDFGYYDISGKDFINCNLTNANFITAKPVRDCNFKDCYISHTKFGDIMRCDFDNCHGFQTDFQKSEIKETDFFLCDLEKADFRESNIFESAFNHCVIKEANFSDGELFSVNFLNNNLLKGVNFDNSKMENVDITDTLLYGCSIQKADIKSVSFLNSNFIRSNLSESNFQNTSIWHSDVVSTDLSNAKFKESDLGSVYFTQPVKGLETCIFDQCRLPYNYEDMILSPKDKIEKWQEADKIREEGKKEGKEEEKLDIFKNLMTPILQKHGNIKEGIKLCKVLLPSWDEKRIQTELSNLQESLSISAGEKHIANKIVSR